MVPTIRASFALVALCCVLAAASANCLSSEQKQAIDEQSVGVEFARALQLAASAPNSPVEQESHQRVSEAFSRLMQSMSTNSINNVRRLVSRLTNLVGGEEAKQQKPSAGKPSSQYEDKQVIVQQEQFEVETEKLVQQLEETKQKPADEQTLRRLNDDVSRLVSTLGDSYLRNLRRLIERMETAVGKPSNKASQQMPDRLDDPNHKDPGFPGWDELIVAVDRIQKSVAGFVRSSTRLVFSG